MPHTLIAGVILKPLKCIPDERGHLMELVRKDDEVFEKFGQVYVTTTRPGIVKAWHLHRLQDDNAACVQGMIRLALFDPRPESPTKDQLNEFFIGIHNPMLVHIPKGVYHGWKGISEEEAIVVNLVTEAYNYAEPDEERLPWNTQHIPFDWEVQHG